MRAQLEGERANWPKANGSQLAGERTAALEAFAT